MLLNIILCILTAFYVKMASTGAIYISLSQAVVYPAIYLFMWFWYLVISIASGNIAKPFLYLLYFLAGFVVGVTMLVSLLFLSKTSSQGEEIYNKFACNINFFELSSNKTKFVGGFVPILSFAIPIALFMLFCGLCFIVRYRYVQRKGTNVSVGSEVDLLSVASLISGIISAYNAHMGISVYLREKLVSKNKVERFFETYLFNCN